MRSYFDDGRVSIYHADARDVLPALSVDVVVTDPPYGIGWKRGVNHARRSKAHAGILNDEDTSVRDEVLALMPDIPGIVFGSFYAPFPPNTKQVLVWHKPADAGLVGSVTGFRRDAEPIFIVGPWPNRKVQWSSVLRTVAGQAGTVAATGHPHTKPLALMTRLLDACPPGTVVDPFMGSGSTLVAAKQVGRRAIGIELDERYCETAARRLSQEVLDLGAA